MRTLLQNAWLLDDVPQRANLLIDGSIIDEITPETPKADRVVDLSGCTVLPGWVDVDAPRGEKAPGVTAARVRAAETDRSPVSGMLLSRSLGTELPQAHTLRAWQARGYGGISIPASALRNPDEAGLRSVCQAAARLGMWVTARANSHEQLQTLISCGITELADVPDFLISEGQLQRMVTGGVCMTCTGAAAMKKSPAAADNLHRFHRAGGLITVGSGGAGRHLYGMALRFLLDAGLPMESVLCAASRWGALVLGQIGRRGTLTPGSRADLTVLRGNPMTDSRALEQVCLVVDSGELRQTETNHKIQQSQGV